jgi:hypothetical protein
MLEYLLNVLVREGHDGFVSITALLERNQAKTEQRSVESPSCIMDYPMGTLEF